MENFLARFDEILWSGHHQHPQLKEQLNRLLRERYLGQGCLFSFAEKQAQSSPQL